MVQLYTTEEFLIVAICNLLKGSRHIAVGMASPIPGSASLLQRRLSSGYTRVSILQSSKLNTFTSGGFEVFDLAAQGRIDTFFLSGGQIDGNGNVNLVGTGTYPKSKTRWSGSFGSAYLYFLIPKVILFRFEHSRRVMVPEVDFISTPGSSEHNVYRKGGPFALVTNLCVFTFETNKKRFRLKSIHPGHTLEEVRDNTGFQFEIPEQLNATQEPNRQTIDILRQSVSLEIAEAYPEFAQNTFHVTI